MRTTIMAACLAILPLSSALAQDALGVDPRLAPMGAHYERLEQAYAEADAAMILAYRTPDFYVEAPGGMHFDHDAATDILLNFVETSQPPIELNVDIQCARMVGESEASIVVTQHLERTVSIDGAPQEVQSEETQTETWRLTPEGWRLASITDIHGAHLWINGVAQDQGGDTEPTGCAATSASE